MPRFFVVSASQLHFCKIQLFERVVFVCFRLLYRVRQALQATDSAQYPQRLGEVCTCWHPEGGEREEQLGFVFATAAAVGKYAKDCTESIYPSMEQSLL